MRRPRKIDFDEGNGTIDLDSWEEAYSDYEDAEYERKRDMDLDAQEVEGELKREKGEEDETD